MVGEQGEGTPDQIQKVRRVVADLSRAGRGGEER
jgi:hypothetical protein